MDGPIRQGGITMSTATLTRKRQTTTVEVEVDVDISDLVENGWHHEDDCPDKQFPVAAPRERAAEAIRSLHAQAHPSQPADPFLCREEPCRSLPPEVTMTRMGRGQ
jgi:hypothetical protein